MPTEERIFSAKSIFPVALVVMATTMAVYTVLTRDNGLTVFPWATVLVGLLPLAGLLAAAILRSRSPVPRFNANILMFVLFSTSAMPVMALTGWYKSPLWIFLLLPVLGAGSELRSLGSFVLGRIWLTTVLFAVYVPFVARLSTADWLQFVLQGAALTVVGMVVWHLVNRERRQREALTIAETALREINQDLEERVGRQVEEIQSARQLQRYLSPQLAQAIMAGQTIELSTTRKEVTVFFSDIRGFTSLSEQLEPEELIQMMNEYLSAMTEIVFRFDGTLDKYIGDAIMVFFNDPADQPDHALRCVRMALAMQARLKELQGEWFHHGSEPLSMGIGINTGYVTVGNIGSSARMEYTVLGNNVNLASRLCSAAAPGQILVSQKTNGLIADEVETAFLREEMVKGKARPVRLYQALGERELAAASTAATSLLGNGASLEAS